MIGPMSSASARPSVTLRLGHSPDPDDAFMWWPLFRLAGEPPRIDCDRFGVEQVTADIETLNQRAIAGDDPLEITALSCATYPRVKYRYALTACGSSMGDAYGPKVVARTKMSLDDLKSQDVTIAVPGEGTTAFAAMSLLLGKDAFRHRTRPFKQIIDEVAAGRFAAGLIIHEGQLTFAASGLQQVVDLGAWWSYERRLPLPLGVNAIRRDLESLYGTGTLREVTGLLRQSVEYALAHREESVAYALRFARDMTSDLADEFIRLYVNRWTLDFGDVGREAVRTFLRETHKAGLTPDAGAVDFVA
jgi:1,4-dihydroxy-6-naphthoate synthase